MRSMMYIATITLFLGCGEGGNRILTPVPKTEKTDAQLTEEMMQGVIDVQKEMEAGPPK